MADKMKFWGVVPTIMQMTRDPTNFYIGRALWFSVTFLYASIVYIVQISWFGIKEDFQCHGNISEACVAECYENHFTMPVLGVWYMIGFVFSSIFFAMEFLVSQTIHRHTKKFKKQSLEEEKKASDITDNEDDNEKQEAIVDLSRKKPLLAMYLGYFLMQMSVQMVFLIILFCYQRPLIKEHIWCSTLLCKGHYLCVIMGTQEKIMSITILATFSAVIMTFCVIFFLYIIHTYILVGITLSDRHRGSIKC